jgi:hypothetical protein
MLSIQVYQDQLEYVGLFATPAFGLRSGSSTVVSGLYHAFLGMHSGLAAFQTESNPGIPLVETIVVNLTDRGTYRLNSERIEWTFPAAGALELDASVLARGDAWLRSTLPTLTFQHHYYTYFAHTWVVGGSAKEFLISLGSPQLEGVGENQGTGLIFHVNFPDYGWSLQITVDHSHVLAEGLFVQAVATVVADRVNHQQTVSGVDRLLRESLARLGLQLERSVG